jgi:tRNA A37 N6-isopentenylltransferase MiaA
MDDTCPDQATCKSISGIGLCTYDDMMLGTEHMTDTEIATIPHHIIDDFGAWLEEQGKNYAG